MSEKESREDIAPPLPPDEEQEDDNEEESNKKRENEGEEEHEEDEENDRKRARKEAPSVDNGDPQTTEHQQLHHTSPHMMQHQQQPFPPYFMPYPGMYPPSAYGAPPPPPDESNDKDRQPNNNNPALMMQQMQRGPYHYQPMPFFPYYNNYPPPNQMMMQQHPPPQRPSRGISLALSCDVEQLSDYQIMVRQQLELFEAGQEDVESNTQGRKKPVVLGQVGLRCRHCACLPLRGRGRGAIYYPQKLSGIYQAAQNMAGSHLCNACQQAPGHVKDELKRLRSRKDNASGGKQYWADGARALGVVETEKGLTLQRQQPPEHQQDV